MAETSGDVSGAEFVGPIDDRIDAVVAAGGSFVARAADTEAAAARLAATMRADLVAGIDGLDAAVERCVQAVEDRVTAHAALELGARPGAAAVSARHRVADVVELRDLVGRIQRADALAEASRDAVRARVETATGIAVHPDSIRKAAADVVAARESVAARRAAVDEAASVSEPERDHAPAAAIDAPERWWVSADRRTVVRGAVGVVVALVVGMAGAVVLGNPVALALPAIAVGAVVVVLVRQRDDALDAEVASENLAAVSRLADRAYGGASAVPELPEVDEELQQELVSAVERLRYAEASWRSLVGPEADVDELDEVLRARDPQHGVTPEALERAVSVAAATAYCRRLRARWKVAWWALDRPVPALEDADGALDSLEADGVAEVSVPTHAARSGFGGPGATTREGLARGRTDAELRDAAEQTITPVVVHDAVGEVGADALCERTARLPEDVRVVVVAPLAEGED